MTVSGSSVRNKPFGVATTLVLLASAFSAALLWQAGARAQGAPDSLEAVIVELSTADKVGQLLMAGFSGIDAAGAGSAIRELRVGGIVLGDGRNATQTREATDQLQAMAREAELPPLLVSIDQEGSPVQPIHEGVTTFVSNWVIGQIQPPSLGRETACVRGATHGRELAGLGIQMNLAPVLDVWDNAKNTVIAMRSFSNDPAIAARLGAAYVEALQGQGVLAVGKHFPGHGSSSEDSHISLPVVGHDRAWLESHELIPFRAAINAGVAAIMTDHVSYPAIDRGALQPASLSATIVTGMLRDDLGFDGLVLTDDIGEMKAITTKYEPGEAAVEALLAGSDMLIVVGPLESQRRMAQAITAEIGGRIPEARLEASVRRVLVAKQQAGLFGPARPPPSPKLTSCTAP